MNESATLTRADLANAILEGLGQSRRGSLELVASIIEHMSAALERGENVKISNFGTFQLRDKGERVGRNPKTRKEAVITPRRVVTFRASTTIKNTIAGSRS